MRRDLAASAILLIVAVAYYVASIRLGRTALSDAVGPAGLPRVYAIALTALAVTIGLNAWLIDRFGSAADALPSEQGKRVDRRSAETHDASHRLRRAGGVVAIGIGYLIIVSLIGYPLAMALMIAAVAVYQGERPRLRTLLIAGAGATALYVLFDIVLGVALPTPWAS